ncbi:MAG: hypothetical protein JW909_05520 [Planctomycetes bacterium]|nr:hypothetical protein [Planctomycetota bacterium]
MTEKHTGTVVFDGLLEGPLPGTPGSEEKLRSWVGLAARSGMRFSLEIDGGTFSILAEDAPVDAAALPPSPEEQVTEALKELLKIFPAAERTRLFSTLRSVEYLEGSEVQTLYVMRPGGEISAESRTVAADTTERPAVLTRAEKTRLGLLGSGAALLVLLAVGLLFRGSIAEMLRDLAPVDARDIEIENDVFGEYFTVEDRKAGSGGSSLVLMLKRTGAFPLSDEAADALYREKTGLAVKLAVESLAAGHARCEFYGRGGEYLGASEMRFAGLRDGESVETSVNIAPYRRCVRMRVTY